MPGKRSLKLVALVLDLQELTKTTKVVLAFMVHLRFLNLNLLSLNC